MEFEVKAPILGFGDLKKVHLQKIDDNFMKLENVDDEYPVFTLINPFALREYEFEIPVAMKILLELDGSQNILVLNIMILHEDMEKSTINFLAPLIFNFDKGVMGQVILDSNKYLNYGLTEHISKYIPNDEAQESIQSK